MEGSVTHYQAEGREYGREDEHTDGRTDFDFSYMLVEAEIACGLFGILANRKLTRRCWSLVIGSRQKQRETRSDLKYGCCIISDRQLERSTKFGFIACAMIVSCAQIWNIHVLIFTWVGRSGQVKDRITWKILEQALVMSSSIEQ